MSSSRYSAEYRGYRAEITVTYRKGSCSVIGSVFAKDNVLLPASIFVQRKGDCTKEHLLSAIKKLEQEVKRRKLYYPYVKEALLSLEQTLNPNHQP